MCIPGGSSLQPGPRARGLEDGATFRCCFCRFRQPRSIPALVTPGPGLLAQAAGQGRSVGLADSLRQDSGELPAALPEG